MTVLLGYPRQDAAERAARLHSKQTGKPHIAKLIGTKWYVVPAPKDN